MTSSQKIFACTSAALLAWALTGCAENSSSPPPPPPPGAEQSPSPSPSPSPSELPNACPAEGCIASIASVAAAEGGELSLTISANFAPDVSRNHFHVYWDRFQAQQVSDDAQPRFGVAQGEWVPTADNPFLTSDVASTTKREGSTRLCVVAGDRNHNVLDPDRAQCYDVGSLL